jgi:uncharacterized protein YneF (UPF0154 family)
MKVVWGILLGFCLVFVLLWGYRNIINPNYILSIPQFVSGTSRKRPAQEDIIALKSQSLNLEEKIASANKRVDDLLIFGGIIITLLLAINVGVYVNAEKQADKYFRDNFEIHKQKILKYLVETEEAANKIKAELELTVSERKQIESV